MKSQATKLSIPSQKILMQAADWQARLWSEDVSEDDKRACLDWRQSDSKHEQAWRILNGFNEQFDQLPKSQQDILFKPSTPLTHWIKGGALFCGLVGIFSFIIYHQQLFTFWTADYRSAVGEVKVIKLSDGTQLTLNSSSAANFDVKNRSLSVLKGTVLIETGHNLNNKQPLIVHSLQTTITPLGTKFAVQPKQRTLDVSVYEGIVELKHDQLKQSLYLNAGQQVKFDVIRGQTTLTSSIPTDLAWIQHKLVVEQMPLCDFVAQLANYHTGYIMCDKKLQNLKVSGTYSLDQRDRIFKQLLHTQPITITQYSQYYVRIKAK